MLNPIDPELKYLVELDNDFLSLAENITLGENSWVPVCRRGKTLERCIFLSEEDIVGSWKM